MEKLFFFFAVRVEHMASASVLYLKGYKGYVLCINMAAFIQPYYLELRWVRRKINKNTHSKQIRNCKKRESFSKGSAEGIKCKSREKNQRSRRKCWNDERGDRQNYWQNEKRDVCVVGTCFTHVCLMDL